MGGSDADYETDDETESDYTERDSDDVYSEEEESEKIILKGFIFIHYQNRHLCLLTSV